MNWRSIILILWTGFNMPLVSGSCKKWFLEDCKQYQPNDCFKKLKVPDCLELENPITQRQAVNDICKSKVCFILQKEPGLVNVRKNGVIPKTPVLCKNLGKDYPYISGPVLDIFSETFSEDEYCLFVSNEECGKSQLMHYIESEDLSEFNLTTGPIAEATLQKCHHQESGAWLDDSIVLVGSFADSNTLVQARLVFEPFENRALWFLGFMAALFVAFASVIFVRIKLERMGKLSFFFILTGAYDDATKIHELKDENLSQRTNCRDSDPETFTPVSSSHTSDRKEDANRAWKIGKIIPMKYAVVTSLIRFSLYATIVTFLLFLEAGAVNDLTERQQMSNKKLLNPFGEAGDKSIYCVQRDTVISEVANMIFSNTSTGEFHSEASIMDCFSQLRDENSKVQFVVAHKLSADFILSEEDLCDQYTVLEIDSRIYEFNSRWVFNSNVRSSYIEKFDRKLVSLRIAGKIQELRDRYAPECTKKSEVMGFRTAHISVLIAIFVMIPFLFGLGSCVYFRWKKLRF